jgi:hypothetical protein
MSDAPKPKRPVGRPFLKGDDPRREGNGAKRGTDGSTKFKAMCRKMAEDKAVLGNVRHILSDDRHPHFLKLWTTLCEFGHGKALQSMEINGSLPVLKVVDTD